MQTRKVMFLIKKYNVPTIILGMIVAIVILIKIVPMENKSNKVWNSNPSTVSLPYVKQTK